MLYRKHSLTLEGYFVSKGLPATEAQDLVHEVFRELGQGRAPKEPNAYIYAIARNILSWHRRRKMAELAVLDEYCRRVVSENRHSPYHAPGAGSHEGDPAVEVKRIIETVTAKLPAKHVELLTLRFSKGLSARELAPLMKCSEDAVQKRIQRLRVVLRRLIREETM
jgi:RNA polymerase sigma factor (sigma-70 family)